ncbi:Xylulose kinase [compost metagenome]
MRKAEIGKDELIGLGFSSAMHSLVIVNEDGSPISPVLIWADGRSSDQADHISEAMKNQIYSRTGTPVHPMTPFVKLLWMKETSYEPYLNAAYVMSIKEYLIHCWYGERMIDYSMASGTGLFNPSTLQWDQELLELVGITNDQLSKIVPPTTILRGINPDVAEQMGIDRELPFVIGAADGQLANLGIGALLPGEVVVSVGTSGAIRQFTNQAKVSEYQETFCYCFTKDSFIIGGPTNNGGIVLQWLKDLFNDKGDFGEFLNQAKRVEPGSEGLLFLPYLNGERAPIWNQRAKGNFYGLMITHKKEHFIRAVLEGVTFNLYQIGRALEKLAGHSEKIYVNGGLSRSSIWLQMMADIFETEIYVSENHHSASWGAAWTALVALEQVNSFEEIKDNIPMGMPVIPNEKSSKLYKEIYSHYEKLANKMDELF